MHRRFSLAEKMLSKSSKKKKKTPVYVCVYNDFMEHLRINDWTDMPKTVWKLKYL